MSPTLHPGDYLWIRRASFFQRGQIALTRKGEADLHLKRIIGMPGESVAIRAGIVQIRGQALPESYVPEASRIQPQSDQSWDLEPEQFIVLGDARDDSLDSRRLGPVSVDQIIGVAVCRLWPPPFALR
jgi:signal peptidase I